jgi:hypothetical protein
MCTTEKIAMRDALEKTGRIAHADVKAFFYAPGSPDPLLPAMQSLREDHERRSRA